MISRIRVYPNKIMVLVLLAVTAFITACGGGGETAAAPTPVERSFTLTEDSEISFATNMNSCDDLRVERNPDNGLVSCADNTFIYQPDPNFWGTDSYEYRTEANGVIERVVFHVSQQSSDSVEKVLIGEDAFCALLSNGTVQCFGSPRFESLIDTTQTGIDDMSAGYSPLVGFSHVCLLESNTVSCNGYATSPVPTLYNPTALFGAGLYNCALHDYGLACWGELDEIVVPTVSNPTAIAAASGHLCVIDTGVLTCTGKNGSPFFTDGRIDVPPLMAPEAVAAGDTSTCAINAGQVVCWGYFMDSSANLNAADATPDDFSAPVAIAVGASHACAIDDAGVRCWGIDRLGRLDAPANLINPRAVFIHGDSSCVLDDNGLQCWRQAYSLYGTEVPGNLYSQP